MDIGIHKNIHFVVSISFNFAKKKNTILQNELAFSSLEAVPAQMLSRTNENNERKTTDEMHTPHHAHFPLLASIQ